MDEWQRFRDKNFDDPEACARYLLDKQLVGVGGTGIVLKGLLALVADLRDPREGRTPKDE